VALRLADRDRKQLFLTDSEVALVAAGHPAGSFRRELALHYQYYGADAPFDAANFVRVQKRKRSSYAEMDVASAAFFPASSTKP
jgi:hypothetical protein